MEEDSNPEAISSSPSQDGEVCSVDASGYGLCKRCPHLEFRFCYEPHVDGRRHDGLQGVRASAQALVHVVPESPGVSLPGASSQGFGPFVAFFGLLFGVESCQLFSALLT